MQSSSINGNDRNSLTDNYNTQLLAHHHRNAANQYLVAAFQASTGYEVFKYLRNALTSLLAIPVQCRSIEDYDLCVSIQINLAICPLKLAEKYLLNPQDIANSAQHFKIAFAEHKPVFDLVQDLKSQCPVLASFLEQKKLLYIFEYLALIGPFFKSIERIQQHSLDTIKACLASQFPYREDSQQAIDKAIKDALDLNLFVPSFTEFTEQQDYHRQFLHDMANLLSPYANNFYSITNNLRLSCNYHAAIVTLLKKIPATQQSTDVNILVHRHTEAIIDLIHINALISNQIFTTTYDISALYTRGFFKGRTLRTPATTITYNPGAEAARLNPNSR
jgi:hypothetical protein